MTTKEAAVSEPVAKYDRGEQEVRAEFSIFKDRQYFSIRTWYDDKGEMKPARNGINLPVDETDEFLRLVVALFPEKVQLIKQGEG